MMKIIILGKENVGKSSLFNYLTNKNYALVSNIPGLTIDNNKKIFNIENKYFQITDTQGLKNDFKLNNILYNDLKICDHILYMINAEKINNEEINFIKILKNKIQKNISILINKIDLYYDKNQNIDFNDILYISIKNNINLKELKTYLYQKNKFNTDISLINKNINKNIINIIGKKNSGKSTLTNRLMNCFIVQTNSKPGTTVDSIKNNFYIDNTEYILFDNPGIEKNKKNIIEYCIFSKTFETIKKSTLNILMIDQYIGITKTDIKIIKYVLNIGKSLIILINKTENNNQKQNYELSKKIKIRFPFLEYIDIIMISAKFGIGIKHIKNIIKKTFNKKLIITNNIKKKIIQNINKNEKFHYHQIKHLFLIKQKPLTFKVILINNIKITSSKIRFIIKEIYTILKVKNMIIKIIF